MIHEVGNKRKSTSPSLVGQYQKLDTVVDVKLTGDLDSTSIFIKVTGHRISDGSSRALYTHCRMNFADDPVQTQTTQFMYLSFSAINALD